jgi:uncharacterized membrane protein
MAAELAIPAFDANWYQHDQGTISDDSDWAHGRVSFTFLFLAAFIACAVEMVEALTIVLAVGTTRGWRSPLIGAATAALALAVIIAVLGPALTRVPISALRLVVGGLLLAFGLQWLRKAILRASGNKAYHDENAIFAHELELARKAGHEERAGLDWYSFTLSFKGVFLEGLEVAFIVVTFSSRSGGIPIAVSAAALALLVVVVTGVLVRAPLSRVPENTMKFSVGAMLTTFGIFWGAEGAGASWPGGDGALLVILSAVALTSIGFVRVLRKLRPLDHAASGIAQPTGAEL